jgi:uncharacterized protein (TIGR03382 family)
MRNLLILSALLLSSAASAQVSVTLKLSTGQSRLSFGPTDCADRPVTATWTRSGNACDSLSLWLTAPNKECGDAAGVGDVGLNSIPRDTLIAQTTGTFQFNLNRLLFPTADGGGGCESLQEEVTFRLCGTTKAYASLYDTSTCATSVTKASGMELLFDGKPPEAPAIESASGLDQAVTARVSEPTGSTRIQLVVSRDGEEVKRGEKVVGQGDIKVEGLVNEVTYQLVAYAFDEAGNQSGASGMAEATPIKTNGFLEEYIGAGGKETGGCGAAGGGVVGGAVLAVLGFWLSSRRNRS